MYRNWSRLSQTAVLALLIAIQQCDLYAAGLRIVALTGQTAPNTAGGVTYEPSVSSVPRQSRTVR
jgi:hypothetical protein